VLGEPRERKSPEGERTPEMIICPTAYEPRNLPASPCFSGHVSARKHVDATRLCLRYRPCLCVSSRLSAQLIISAHRQGAVEVVVFVAEENDQQ
jgi:hypothetical protein